MLLKSLNVLAACEPQPAEVLIHIDANDDETEAALAAAPLPVSILHAETTLGAGGGRNRLMHEASHDIMVSLDDDSYPIDKDFFRQVMQLTDTHPEFSVFALPSWSRGETPYATPRPIRGDATFEGCAAVLRRTALVSVAGYLPLCNWSHGMEECDISLQLLDAGFALARVDQPHVRHDVTPTHHDKSALDRAWLINTALLPFLRYPFPYVLLLPIKVLRRLLYSLRRGRFGSIFSALVAIPGTFWEYRHLRAPVKGRTIRRSVVLRKNNTTRA
jgi:GT2 family glycosyltransferase